MKASVVESFGGPEALQLRELSRPSPTAGEVLIEVANAGVNRADVLARSGNYYRAGPPPLIVGLEGAGLIAAIGAGVEGVDVGDRVVGHGATNAPGFYAQYVALPAANIVPVPADVGLPEASAIPTAWLSAYYTLIRLARLERDETVLIHGVTSGVGSAAAQIALDMGARVIGVASSPEKVAWAREIGVERVINRRTEELADQVLAMTNGHGAEVVLDTVGGEVFALSLKLAGYGGRVVSMANMVLEPSLIDTRDFYPRNISIHGFQITSLIEHGYQPRSDIQTILARVGAVVTGFRSTGPMTCPRLRRRIATSSPGKISARSC